jgi:hypothetical protein
MRQSADRHLHLLVLLGEQADAQLFDLHDDGTENFLAVDKFDDVAQFHAHVINNPPHESQLTPMMQKPEDSRSGVAEGLK